jgi:hypothetical protein
MVRTLFVATLAALALHAAACSLPPLVASAQSVPRTAVASESGAISPPAFPREPQSSLPPAREDHLLYPDNLPRYGNDLAAELERAGAGSVDASSRAP